MLLSELNEFIDKGNKYICVSRPRRFGKTIATNMMCAYYSKGCDSREMFKDLKISKADNYEKYLNKLNFIAIDVASEYSKYEEKMLDKLSEKVKSEFKEQFPTVMFDEDESIAHCILKVYAETNETFVIVIDEYDYLVRIQASQNLLSNYLSFLGGIFKSNTLSPAISLAYLTGILPVIRLMDQTKLNNVWEYTILDAYNLSEYVGFTDEEVKPLCEKFGVDFQECKREYDGYAQNGFEIYNPESVVKCMQTKSIESFWSKTSTYQVITDRLKENYKGIKDDVVRMIAGESVKVDTGMYLNTMTDFVVKDDVLTYLIHLGYLAYNKDDKTCRIPNKEVEKEWFRAVSILKNYSVTDKIIKSSEELLNQTLLKNCRAVEKALDKSHIHVASNRSYNNEDALMSAIYLAYIYAKNEYTVIKEMTTGKGFADVVFIPFYPGKPAMIIELKRNGSTESALSQIQAKEYYDSLEHYQGNLLFVGINYDEKSKKHQCEILEFEKE